MKILNMKFEKIASRLVVLIIGLSLWACIIPSVQTRKENRALPEAFSRASDTANISKVNWRQYFTDTNLTALIDTALMNNQELNILLQEIAISKNEVKARKGEYLPFIGVGGGAGLDKVGRYTRNGVIEKNHEIADGKEFPEPLGDFNFGAYASWELDVWKKLRNSRKSAMMRYLASIDGRNFMVTNLVSEIADSYFELLALDNQLEILKYNVEIQQKALSIVKMQKIAARVTELAVRKFEAEVLLNQSRQYEISQHIIIAENRINFLLGRFPQHIPRDSLSFTELMPFNGQAGIPTQLLTNRPDVRRAELELMASNLDVKVAKANFYPSFSIKAGVGYQAFNTSHLLMSPESMIYSLAGDLMVPVVNRNAIKANYYSASARQIQAVYNYERSILSAYIDVTNQLAKISMLEKSYQIRSKQVQALTRSIHISTGLFKSARADYMEVLMTQRDALNSKMELIETKRKLLNAKVNVYKALGGGWR